MLDNITLISLITTTVDSNFINVKKLFDSLNLQTYFNFEVIFLNQTTSSFDCHEYNFHIHEIPSEFISLSKARNLALQEVSGEIVGFPDDDCFYSKDALKMINHAFQTQSSISFLYANHIDPETKISETSKFFHDKESINARNLKFSNSITIFVKMNDFIDIKYDENMGVGAMYGSSEESDYILQAIKHNKTGVFIEEIKIYHRAFGNYPSISTNKAYLYSLGLAHFWFKNRQLLGNINLVINLFIKPVLGLLIAIIQISHDKIRVRYAKLSAIIVYTYQRYNLENND